MPFDKNMDFTENSEIPPGEEKCATCFFFQPGAPDGVCHLRPGAMPTQINYWCGDHRSIKPRCVEALDDAVQQLEVMLAAVVLIHHGGQLQLTDQSLALLPRHSNLVFRRYSAEDAPPGVGPGVIITVPKKPAENY